MVIELYVLVKCAATFMGEPIKMFFMYELLIDMGVGVSAQDSDTTPSGYPFHFYNVFESLINVVVGGGYLAFFYAWVIDGHGCVGPSSSYSCKEEICWIFFCVLVIDVRGCVWSRVRYVPKGLITWIFFVWFIGGRGCVVPRINYGSHEGTPLIFLCVWFIYWRRCDIPRGIYGNKG